MKAGVYDVEAIRAALPLRMVCEREGLVFRRSGSHVTACCPFHAERTGSFTIQAATPHRAHCFGCGWGGDVFAFWGQMRGLDASTSSGFLAVAGQLASLCGMARRLEGVEWSRKDVPKRKALGLEESGRPWLPVMRRLRAAELAQLAELRGLSVAGLEAAVEDGRLGWSMWPLDAETGRARAGSKASWVVTDAERWVAQFRPLDGSLYAGRGGADYKSSSTRNVGWPVGAAQGGAKDRVVLVEGGADMLAAYAVLEARGWLEEVAVWCLFGASARMAPEGLAFARGRRVRVLADNDAPRVKEYKGRGAVALCPGMEAAARWGAQLVEAGAAEVSTYDLSPLGQAVGDLNDLVRSDVGDVDWEDVFCF